MVCCQHCVPSQSRNKQLRWCFTIVLCMMTSSNGNIFRVTGPLWGESTGHRWIPITKVSDAEFDIFYCTWTYGWENNRDAGDLRYRRAHYDVTVMAACQATPLSHFEFAGNPTKHLKAPAHLRPHTFWMVRYFHHWTQILPAVSIGADGYCRRPMRMPVRPSARPERRYASNSLRISAIGLKFGGMMHNTMKQLTQSMSDSNRLICKCI